MYFCLETLVKLNTIMPLFLHVVLLEIEKLRMIAKDKHIKVTYYLKMLDDTMHFEITYVLCIALQSRCYNLCG